MPASTTSPAVNHHEIARKAYEKFESRGYRHGDDQADWFAAEAELQASITAIERPKGKATVKKTPAKKTATKKAPVKTTRKAPAKKK